MNTHLIKMLSQPVIERLGWTLFHSFWQGSVIAVMLAVALMQLHQATHRHTACLGALLIMLACSVATFRTVTVSASGLVPATMPRVASSPIEGAQALETQSLAATPIETVRPDQEVREVLRPCLPWLAGVWMFGVALLSLKQLFAWTHVRRWRVRHCRPAGADLEGLLLRLCERLGSRRVVRLMECASASTPMLLGWFKPVVILPASVITGLSREQIEAILAHELAHLRRGDAFVLWFQRVMGTLFFFQPAVWWINRRLCIEREHCCDDLAVAGGTVRETLAAALGALALGRDTGHMPAPLAADGHMPVLGRIQRLLQPAAGPERGVSWPLTVLSTFTSLAALILILVNCHKPEAMETAQSAAKAPKFTASAKVIVGWPVEKMPGAFDTEGRAEFRATQIEILESGELKRRTQERVRALHPGVKEVAVEIHAARVKDSAIIEVLASAEAQNYAQYYLSSLLDEYIAFRKEMIEKSLGTAMNKVIEQVLMREKSVKVKQAMLADLKRKGQRASDPESFKIECEIAESEYRQTKEDYDDWKRTLDRIDAAHVIAADPVSVMERPGEAVKAH